MARLSVEIPDCYLEVLQEEAESRGVTVEELVRAMIRERVVARLAGGNELCRCIDVVMKHIDGKRFWDDLYMWLADLRGAECLKGVEDSG